jgi:hypothetical protein
VPCTVAPRRRRSRPELELADIFRQWTDQLPRLDGQQACVVRDILRCRTAALGGHLHECDRCGLREIAYNSCRNRHCPKCQGLQQFRWLAAQQQHLLPIEYHHVVFTIPDQLHTFFRANPKLAYGLLFAAVAETLHDVANNPKNLGAKIGFSCVLHSWTQKLLFHPHIHCIVTGGGLHPDGQRWVSAKRGFLFPVRILGQVFRGKLLRKFELSLDHRSLRLQTAEANPHARLRASACKNWVVYSKPPFAGPEQVLRYLGRYTHRVAISNHRLVALEQGRVTFRWRDRANANSNRLLTLDVTEFVRRFLLHLVPQGLMRIRHYGLLANPTRKKHLERCRTLLGVKVDASSADETSTPSPVLEPTFELLKIHRCPRCETGTFVVIGCLTPVDR